MKNESWDVYGAVHVYIMFLDIDDLLTILSIQIHRVYYILKHGYVIQISIIQPFFDLYSRESASKHFILSIELFKQLDCVEIISILIV